MIVVSIELHPNGEYAGSSQIGRMVVWNDGAGTKDVGTYGVAMECKAVGKDAWAEPQYATCQHLRRMPVRYLIEAAVKSIHERPAKPTKEAERLLRKVRKQAASRSGK